MPPAALAADQVVLLVLDGLGWCQLQDHRDQLPVMSSLEGGPITTVAPSTTAAALTSIATGLPPGEHGVVGYRIRLENDVVNMLRWSTDRGDARGAHPPTVVQPHEAFCGQRPAIVTRAEFSTTGFTQAHLAGARFHGYRVMSSLVAQVTELVRGGEPFVYAYYEGVDKVAHEYGLGAYYRAELRSADTLVSWLLEDLPAGTAVVIVADHGQVETGDNIIEPHPTVLASTSMQSGEGRFRWLHARPGRARALYEAARTHHDAHAWVRTRDEVIDEQWFGPKVGDELAARLGDVCLVAKGTVAFHDPADTGPFRLIGRHGSLTAAEMLVPLLVGLAR
ncbi:MAG: alkaline phosphatase family protein [Acidimicrobiales bacterium]|nr:alkaline phosphatase family protein [Acidimicrobiales bacterium]